LFRNALSEQLSSSSNTSLKVESVSILVTAILIAIS